MKETINEELEVDSTANKIMTRLYLDNLPSEMIVLSMAGEDDEMGEHTIRSKR